MELVTACSGALPTTSSDFPRSLPLVLAVVPTPLCRWPPSQHIGSGPGPRFPVHPRRSRPRRERRPPTCDRHRNLPSGWKYTLHLGTFEDLTLVRYDNAHEDTNGHELHTAAGDIDDIDFPGMEERLVEFWASADEYWDAGGGDPPRPY